MTFHNRNAMTLIELIVVISLMGIFATAAMARFGRSTIGDTGARSEASVLANAITNAQNAAIRTGDSHGILLSKADGDRWVTVRRRSSGHQETVDEHQIQDDVVVDASRTEIWFDFEGHGTAYFDAGFRGPNRQYKVEVLPLSQAVRVTELSH